MRCRIGMRACVLAVLVSACSTRQPAAPAPHGRSFDAWVLGPDGPLGDAEVRVLPLAPARCACPPAPETAEHHYGNEMPECACPAALAALRTRLASCTWPSPATQVI